MNTLAVAAGLSKSAGGPSYSVPGWSNSLARLGVKRILVSPVVPGEEQSPFVDEKWVQWVKVPKPSWLPWAPSFSQTVERLSRENEIEIIHNHGIWLPANHTASRVADRLKIPLLTTPHGMLTAWSLHHKALKKRIAWALYQGRDLKSCRVLHATATSEARDLRKWGWNGPIAVVPNGLEVQPWEEHESPRGIRTALFLSRVHPKKGLLDWVQAWAKVRPSGWEMKIVGTGDEKHLSEVKRAVQQEGLTEVFHFQESAEGGDKWRLYREADLFVLPTHDENFGMVVIEALSCGTPVITTYGAPWEELNARGCGWWVPVGANSLAGALRDAVEATDEQRRLMGRQGRKLVEECYTWESLGPQMKALYEWILGSGSKPDFVS